MNTGAERADAHPEGGNLAVLRGSDFIGNAGEPETEFVTEAEAERPGRKLLGALLIVAALAWIGVAGWTIAQGGDFRFPTLVDWMARLSVPLVLLGVAWIIFGRTQRREAERFTRAVAAMRKESSALDSVLEIVSRRLEDNQARLTDEATKLMALGDEASDRLGRVTHYLSKQSAELDRKSLALENAAQNARVDLGVLMQDLPRAEEQARNVGTAMREAGLTAHEQAGALEGQLGALAARGREADEVVGGAAQRLGAHVARIESSAGQAGERIEHAAASLNAAVDGALVRASEAMEATRGGIEAQGAAMLAAVEQSRAAFEEAGGEAARRLGERLDVVGGKMEALASSLAAQDAASHALVDGLSAELGTLETRFMALDRSGIESSGRLSGALEAVRGSVEQLYHVLEGGDAHAGALSERARDVTEALNALSAQLQIEIPDALTGIEAQAIRAREAAESVSPAVESTRVLADTVLAAAARVEELAARLAAQEQGSRAMFAGIEADLAGIEARFVQTGEAGSFNATRLTGAISDVRRSIQALHADVQSGHEATGHGVEQAQALAAILSAIPETLSVIEGQAIRARVAADSVGPAVESTRALADTILIASARVDDLAARLATQEEGSRALFAGIEADLAAIDSRFVETGETGSANAARLGQAMAEVRASLQALHEDVRSGTDTTGETVARADALAATLAGITMQLEDTMPAALGAVEAQAARTGQTARAIAPDVEAIRASADAAATSLGTGEASLRRQQEELATLLASITDAVTQSEERLRALASAATDADGEAQRIVSDTGPALVEALLRVRETANQAAAHAREAIAAVIPASVAQLAEASRDAVSEAVNEPVQEKIAELAIMSDNAVAAARRASERLTRQLVTIGETAAAIENRIEQERAARDQQDSEGLTRKVALLIESLNSTAIDVTKILSNEVTDTAWQQYLKGDRGVFTRRAVRLLESGEAREIVRHYEADPEFREQVNRYIHDFEAMLRRILADKDGSPLSITLLSSDMGKLYVALAQAIERLRS